MVDRESMEDGTRGPLFTPHVPGIVAVECSTEREFVEILCKFEKWYLQLKTCYFFLSFAQTGALLPWGYRIQFLSSRNHRQPGVESGVTSILLQLVSSCLICAPAILKGWKEGLSFRATLTPVMFILCLQATNTFFVQVGFHNYVVSRVRMVTRYLLSNMF